MWGAMEPHGSGQKSNLEGADDLSQSGGETTPNLSLVCTSGWNFQDVGSS